MAKYNRHHPVSHTLLRDPEFIVLRRRYADWMGYVWLDMLAWGDRTEGKLKGELREICLGLASNSLKNYLKPAADLVENALRYMEECGWIIINSDHILIVKYAEYHRSQEAKKNQNGNEYVSPLPSLPTLPSVSNTEDILRISPATQNGTRSALAGSHDMKLPIWLPEDLWLKELVESQTLVPANYLLDSPWWDSVAETCGGIDKEFLGREFARMAAWCIENASRKPSSRAGWKRFVRGWLERAHEKARKSYGQKDAH